MEKKKLSNKKAREERKEVRQDKREERKEKRKSKKKELDITIDTKRLDIDIDRDADGNVDIEWDGKHVDGKYSKHGNKVSIEVEINDQDTYLFEANGTNRRLPKGAIWKLTGQVIKGFLKRGWGKIKK